MLSEWGIKVLPLMMLGLIACDDKRNFYLSPVANSPSKIEELKERWFFCEKCLDNVNCNINDIVQCKDITIQDRGDALSEAVGSANVEAVAFLVDVAKADVNGRTGLYNETPLMIAAYYGTKNHQKIAEFLISHGADVNATRDSQTTGTALLTAIWKNNVDFAIFLLAKGASPSLTANREVEGSVCSIAIGRGRVNFIPIIPGCCSLIKKDPVLSKSAGCP